MVFVQKHEILGLLHDCYSQTGELVDGVGCHALTRRVRKGMFRRHSGDTSAGTGWCVPGAMLPRCSRKHVPSTVVQGRTCFPEQRGSMAPGDKPEMSRVFTLALFSPDFLHFSLDGSGMRGIIPNAPISPWGSDGVCSKSGGDGCASTPHGRFPVDRVWGLSTPSDKACMGSMRRSDRAYWKGMRQCSPIGALGRVRASSAWSWV
jgi:hypothetical protein